MKTKILFTVVLTLSLNVLWGQWVEVVTGYSNSYSFNLIDCPNTNTCYAASNDKLIKTIDGGDTWVEASTGIPITAGSITGIECTDPDTCFCVNNGVIFKTSDGGQNWNSVSQFNQGGIYFKMVDKQYGYSNIGDYQFAKTTDFGNTWTSFSYLSGIPFNIQDGGYQFDFITDQIGIMAFDANSRDAQEIYKTTDGGLNWVKKFDTIAPPFNYMFRAMDMVTEQVGYVVSTFGEVLKTVDGGETWLQVTPITFLQNFDGVTDLEFIDENNGYISGDAHMYKTTDGGNSWTTEACANGVFSILQEIEIVTYDVVYVATSYENIYKNDNAGLIANIFGIENNQIGRVYPNPINDVIEIDLEQNYFDSKFQLFDLLGNIIFTHELSQGKTTITRNTIPAGAYLFKIIQSNSVLTTGKLVFN